MSRPVTMNIPTLLAEAGEPGVYDDLDDQSSALTMLAASMSQMGARQALLGMLANEQLTNMNYRAVAELPFEDAIADIIERHLADEERHLAWLRDQEPHLRDGEDDVEELAPSRSD